MSGQSVQDSITKKILVLSAPRASFDVSNLCLADTVKFIDKSFVIQDSIVAWNWQFGDGKFSMLRNPGHKYPPTSSSWNIILEVTSQKGCTDTVQKMITLDSVPVVHLSPRELLLCGDLQEIEFVDTSRINYKEYKWIWGDGDTSITKIPRAIHAYNIGEWPIMLLVESEGKCKGTSVGLIKVKPMPQASITIDKSEVPISQPIINFSDNSWAGIYPVIQWRWMLQDTLELSRKQAFPVDFSKPGGNVPVLEPGKYKITLWVTNTEGCTDSTSAYFSILSEPTLFVPNAFTPDGDGINDLFIPQISNISNEGYLLQVYNRWGHLVFETHDYTTGWDGAFHGKPSPPGTYTWIIQFKNQGNRIQQYKGWVVLIR